LRRCSSRTDSFHGTCVGMARVIVGAGDTPFLNGSHYMASRIPHATEVVVQHAAHGANVDQPEVVNQAIQQFLEQL
jgi:pimeloyl-ACP methyl ester carboxylesterase